MRRSNKPKKKGFGCLTVIVVIVVLALISNVFNKNDSDDPTTNPPSHQDNVSETEELSQDTNALSETFSPETAAPETTPNETIMYNQDDITVFPIMTGIGEEKIGEYSVLQADSSDVSVEYLTDWYINHVKKNDYNYCIIVYSDHTELVGVYATSTHILEGCSLWLDDRGDYCLGDSSNATLYFLNENGSLCTLE